MDGSTDNGNLLSASALPCNCVPRNFSVYSYEERNNDYRLTRAEACGEVALHSLSRARRGLWSVTNSNGYPNKYA